MGLFQKTYTRILRKKPKGSTEPGGVIRCHDCKKLGYIAFPGGIDPILSSGWKVTWCGLKPLYICGDCGEKRRRFVKERIRK